MIAWFLRPRVVGAVDLHLSVRGVTKLSPDPSIGSLSPL